MDLEGKKENKVGHPSQFLNQYFLLTNPHRFNIGGPLYSFTRRTKLSRQQCVSTLCPLQLSLSVAHKRHAHPLDKDLTNFDVLHRRMFGLSVLHFRSRQFEASVLDQVKLNRLPMHCSSSAGDPSTAMHVFSFLCTDASELPFFLFLQGTLLCSWFLSCISSSLSLLQACQPSVQSSSSRQITLFLASDFSFFLTSSHAKPEYSPPSRPAPPDPLHLVPARPRNQLAAPRFREQ